MKPVERSPGVEGVFATQSEPVAASVNVMSVKVPPTSMARVQVRVVTAAYCSPVRSQSADRLLHFS